jgi:hypothetical protein
MFVTSNAWETGFVLKGARARRNFTTAYSVWPKGLDSTARFPLLVTSAVRLTIQAFGL